MKELSLPFLQQFPGLGVPPAAPTPPPAAPSSVASFPSYQGGYPQAGFGQGAYGQGVYGQSDIPQRPPPLGQAEALNVQQSMSPQVGPSGYSQGVRNFSTPQQQPAGYNARWQYTDPNSDLARRLSGAPQGAMVPAARGPSGEIVESRSQQTSELYHYQQQYEQSAGPPAPPPQLEEISVPVMLCHTCSHCGRMRSAGFHRNNPVVPGKPLVLTPCRRCNKRIKNHHHSSFARIRTCTAEEPCDWPGESFQVEIEHGERRGRRRSREDVYVSQYFPSRPRVLRRRSNQARLGLRVLQQPSHESKATTRVRVSSLSPIRSSRYGEVWPPPDVGTMPSSMPGNAHAAPPSPLPTHASRADEVWPPPDIVRAHSYRAVERSPRRRTSSRIIELTPSPPPARTRSTRIVYRSQSRLQERRPPSRSLSPDRCAYREERRNNDAEARMTAHPRPYRPVLPEHTTVLRASDETSSNTDSMSRMRGESPNRSILKPKGRDRETSLRRRQNMRESQQSTRVEVGGPRVHFDSERRDERPNYETRGRTRHLKDRHSIGKDFEHYRQYSRHRYAAGDPPAPPIEDFERLRVHRSSLSPRQDLREEYRIDRARRISPSPPPLPRPPTAQRYEEVHMRHVSPPPPHRDQPPSPSRLPPPNYRHVSQTRERTRMPSPLPSRRRDTPADTTDSDSVHSGELTEVRSWRGIDENGQPATFVEEKRRVRMIEQGSERDGEFRPVIGRDRVVERRWRDV